MRSRAVDDAEQLGLLKLLLVMPNDTATLENILTAFYKIKCHLYDGAYNERPSGLGCHFSLHLTDICDPSCLKAQTPELLCLC